MPSRAKRFSRRSWARTSRPGANSSKKTRWTSRTWTCRRRQFPAHSRRQTPGVTPVARRNVVVNWLWSQNPTAAREGFPSRRITWISGSDPLVQSLTGCRPRLNVPVLHVGSLLLHPIANDGGEIDAIHGPPNALVDVPPQFAEWGLALVALLFPRGAVDEPQHLANRDRFRKPCKNVTVARAAVRLHESALFQRRQNRLQKLLRSGQLRQAKACPTW